MKQIFTVSQINSYIHRIFDGDYALRQIMLKGEVSNCKYHSSGHIYFTLKDAGSTLRCVLFAGDRQRGLSFRMEDGQMVVVQGRISVFERDGSYRMYAREIELSGAGQWYLRLEQLKRELAEEGYFDFDKKKKLPGFPRRIGIVTALTGAAIEDIRSVAARRNPYVQLYLYPARVQGEGAAQSIVRGITYFDQRDVDVIIIGRGGGSIEDLWAFNERSVAEAIFRARTPIISGTGHETDMTIADYCADVRAATPSAACEMAIPDVYGILQQMDVYRDALDGMILGKMRREKEQLLTYRRLLEACHPKTKIARQKAECVGLADRLRQVMGQRLEVQKHELGLAAQRLHSLSPVGRLSGGYVFAQDEAGRPIPSVEQIETGEPVTLIFPDGRAKVKVEEIQKQKIL
ncbi:MAG: exodeoxyribonuclease VII large subunit [Eubacteriales bacterium]|nr:exodeoxyribonuclease VII large subunit [Eubacteriales bacterium]